MLIKDTVKAEPFILKFKDSEVCSMHPLYLCTHMCHTHAHTHTLTHMHTRTHTCTHVNTHKENTYKSRLNFFAAEFELSEYYFLPHKKFYVF